MTLKSIANDERPAMELLVDRPERCQVSRASPPLRRGSLDRPVQPLDGRGDDGMTDNDASTHLQRMTEVLRQSKTLRLPGNRELTLAGCGGPATPSTACRGEGRRQARRDRLRARRSRIGDPGLRSGSRGALPEVRSPVFLRLRGRAQCAGDDRGREEAAHSRRLCGRPPTWPCRTC